MDLIQFFGRFHVLVLHLPIGILLLAALLEIHCAFFNKERTKLFNLVWFWGAFSAISACILGYMLSTGGGYSEVAVFIHMAFGISVASIAVICTLFFTYKKTANKFLIIGLASLQLFLLFSTGHYGANMTHGETYLVEHAPNFVRTLAGFEPYQTPRPPITKIEDADIYLDLVKPIFKGNCVSCHNDAKAKGKLNLANIEDIIKGGKTASTWGDGKLNNSELYRRITLDEHHKEFMPAEGKTALSENQVKTLAWWIKSGLPVSGNITTSTLNTADKKIIAQQLGLVAADNTWPLPKHPSIPEEIIVDLQQQGFLVKTIAKDVNYLDVDYSSNLQAIPDQAIAALLEAKKYIAYLNLVNSQITTEQLSSIGQLENLLRLRLNKTPIDDAGLAALQTLTNLQYLNLYSTKITDASSSVLLNISQLKQLYVGQTALTQGAITEISAIKPDLKIFGLSNKIPDFQAATEKVLKNQAKKATL
ncbi:c-type cytochrome domain-containing protein [Paraglaciecola sp. L3A3]|uniref:c-type cytochrome domain-containing protein n=1 Tax=Paraglaciecola sp. L3A3 TaxID=2686358 RepID=UPI00131B8AEC|nr:c-type cytochrome domain-containing protein [Paraglaciecola sp. L3A3]